MLDSFSLRSTVRGAAREGGRGGGGMASRLRRVYEQDCSLPPPKWAFPSKKWKIFAPPARLFNARSAPCLRLKLGPPPLANPGCATEHSTV